MMSAIVSFSSASRNSPHLGLVEVIDALRLVVGKIQQPLPSGVHGVLAGVGGLGLHDER
jgi:hypothetical protein